MKTRRYVLDNIFKGKELLIEICDEVVGLPTVVKEQLFHLGQYTTSNEKENDIELMLCKDFVEKNGGRIWVESQEDNGSRFYFTVPVYALDEESKP